MSQNLGSKFTKNKTRGIKVSYQQVIKEKGTGFTRLKRSLDRFLRANGLMIRGMDRGIRGTKTAIYTEASFITINLMEKALIRG